MMDKLFKQQSQFDIFKKRLWKNAPWSHLDYKGVTVWNLVVDDVLKVYSLQLELYRNIDEPEKGRS